MLDFKKRVSKKGFFYFMHVTVLSKCKYIVCHAHAWSPRRSERALIPGTGVPGGCMLPSGCWSSNPAPLQEQPVLLASEHLSNPKTGLGKKMAAIFEY